MSLYFLKLGAPHPTSSSLQMLLELMQKGCSFPFFSCSTVGKTFNSYPHPEKAALSICLAGSPGWVLIHPASAVAQQFREAVSDPQLIL